MGPVESMIRATTTNGMRLKTVPGRAVFKVGSIERDKIVLLFGLKETRTPLSWRLLESIPTFLAGKEWTQIASQFDVEGVPGGLDQFCRSEITRAVGGYVAGLLEHAGLVDVDLSRPARVRLKSTSQ